MPHRHRRHIVWEFLQHQYDQLVPQRKVPLFQSEMGDYFFNPLRRASKKKQLMWKNVAYNSSRIWIGALLQELSDTWSMTASCCQDQWSCWILQIQPKTSNELESIKNKSMNMNYGIKRRKYSIVNEFLFESTKKS